MRSSGPLRNHELEYAGEKLNEILKMLHYTFEASCVSIKLNRDASKNKFLFNFEKTSNILHLSSHFFNDFARFLDN